MKRLTIQEVARMTQMTYLTRIPTAIPGDQILVHNQVRPARHLGTRGFRAWLSPREQVERYTPCACDWAGEIGQHFRVKPVDAVRVH